MTPAFACPRSATNLKFKSGENDYSYGKLGDIVSMRAFAEGDVTLTLKDGTTYNFNFKQNSYKDYPSKPGWCVSVDMGKVGQDKACSGGKFPNSLDQRTDTLANGWGSKRSLKDSGLIWGEKIHNPGSDYSIFIRNKDNQIVATVDLNGASGEFLQRDHSGKYIKQRRVIGFPDPTQSGINGARAADINIRPLEKRVKANFDFEGNKVPGAQIVEARKLPTEKTVLVGRYNFVNYHAKPGASVKSQIEEPQIISCTENEVKQVEAAGGMIDLGHQTMKNCANAGTNDETAISNNKFKVSKDIPAADIGVRHSLVFENLDFTSGDTNKTGSVKIDRVYSSSIPRMRGSNSSEYDANLFGNTELVTDSSFGCKTRLREKGAVGAGDSSSGTSYPIK